LRRTLT